MHVGHVALPVVLGAVRGVAPTLLLSIYAGRAVMGALPATALMGGRVLLGVDLAEQAVGVAPTVYHVEHVADVYTDTTGQALVKPDVAGE